MLVKFRIWGNLRFLSHAETMSVFQRACVRAGIPVRHSEGFNPRPRMSLPLPRSVGVESDDELLVLVVSPAPGDTAMEQSVKDIEAGLGEQLRMEAKRLLVNGVNTVHRAICVPDSKHNLPYSVHVAFHFRLRVVASMARLARCKDKEAV